MGFLDLRIANSSTANALPETIVAYFLTLRPEKNDSTNEAPCWNHGRTIPGLSRQVQFEIADAKKT